MLLNRGDTPPQGGVSRKVPEGREPLRALQHAKFLNGKAFCPIYLNLKNLKKFKVRGGFKQRTSISGGHGGQKAENHCFTSIGCKCASVELSK